MNAENTAKPIAKFRSMMNMPGPQQTAEHEHVDPHRQHPAKPRGSDPLQDHPGFASPPSGQQPENALDEDGRVERDQERRENDHDQRDDDAGDRHADRLDRADQPLRMIDVSLGEAGDLHRQVACPRPSEAMDGALRGGDGGGQSVEKLPQPGL